MWKNMDTNTCNVNNLDSDALLPPRKRLLAGLKRQNSDVNSPAPLPSSPNCAGSKNDACNNIYRSQLGNPNLSSEEIVEASRIAAVEAAKVAEAARANAEEKAAKAAKAVAAAKSALELVATLSEEAANKEKGLKKNKMKKHVPVETLYNKNKGNSNCRTDEELARKLHQAINSSPRILKNASGSDTRSHKHKRLKSSAVSERPGISSGVPIAEGNRPSSTTSNGNGLVGDTDNEGSLKKIDMIMVDLNASKSDKRDQLKLDNGEGWVPSKSDQMKSGNREAEALVSKDKFAESLDSFGKKRGRIKQKKLPLSICSFRDQTGPKEELKPQGMLQLEDNAVRTAVGNQPLFSMGPSSSSLRPVDKTSMWKCQSFKAPACVKQNKVMQS
ncbi:uncharacterized protein LOC105166698 [Sesamum indicum]|uniref:Uncharacterized protein LOC105166698 n=1 Tax=Sesamum indicum TaxID=4182 RepID=A0A6I9TT43_SESIN|nr:uncharacterized protein LOC105166698 [Sesamum indicum]XP_011084450.1 uncharacterized protein LOC105166698 [Sesamum indicum]